MYYALIILSVCMFGGTFVFNREYQKIRGNDPRASFTFSLVSALVGLPVLLIINGFNLEFTVFTLLMATLSALNGIAFTSCSLSAMGYINLSLFSLFSMLGGMATSALVGPFMTNYDRDGEEVTVGGLFSEIVGRLEKYEAAIPSREVEGGSIYTSFIEKYHRHVTPFESFYLEILLQHIYWILLQ